MTRDVTIEKSKVCSGCGRKLHHGYKAIEISNKKGKVKAYACNDQCSRTVQQTVIRQLD